MSSCGALWGASQEGILGAQGRSGLGVNFSTEAACTKAWKPAGGWHVWETVSSGSAPEAEEVPGGQRTDDRPVAHLQRIPESSSSSHWLPDCAPWSLGASHWPVALWRGGQPPPHFHQNSACVVRPWARGLGTLTATAVGAGVREVVLAHGEVTQG